MRFLNCNVLSGSDSLDVTGDQIDANQLISASFHAYFGDASAEGTLKIQASNDIPLRGNAAPIQNFVATNWIDVPNQSANITVGGSALLTIAQTSYRWLRAVWENTATGQQTITTIADDSALAQIEGVTCVPDVLGSLNSTYFLLYSAHNAATYYVWYNVSGLGVDPMVMGATGIEVDISTGASADDVAVASTGPIAAISGGLVFNANAASDVILIYNLATGPCNICADGAAPTGFAFAIQVPGQDTGPNLLNNEYFFINASTADGGDEYYVWFNVDSGGTDPMLPGKTGVEVDIAGGTSADQVAASVSSALSGIAGTPFSAGVLLNVVTVDNSSAGPFVPASDFDTGFTIAVSSGGGSTINVNLMAMSL